MRYFFCCTAILALIVPVANVEADERVILKKEFSARRDQLTQWREAKLAEPDLPSTDKTLVAWGALRYLEHQGDQFDGITLSEEDHATSDGPPI